MIKTKKVEPPRSEYEQARDSLSDEAERIADYRVRKLGVRTEIRDGKDGSRRTHCFWSEFYHEEMDRLWREGNARS